LLRVPIELEGPDGFEASENRVENFDVDKMAKVAPDYHKDEEVRSNVRGINVVEAFGRL
jgi:hypothetical protein